MSPQSKTTTRTPRFETPRSTARIVLPSSAKEGPLK